MRSPDRVIREIKTHMDAPFGELKHVPAGSYVKGDHGNLTRHQVAPVHVYQIKLLKGNF